MTRGGGWVFNLIGLTAHLGTYTGPRQPWKECGELSHGGCLLSCCFFLDLTFHELTDTTPPPT